MSLSQENTLGHSCRKIKKIICMKKFYLIFICLLFSTCIFCQERVPEYNGIPIDGAKEEMIQKLVETGMFIKCISGDKYDLMLISKDLKDLGITPFVKIHTQDGKVAGIRQDILHLTAEKAKILFNASYIGNLKFNSSDFYVSSGDSIPEKEDIFYEMRFNKKEYKLIDSNGIAPHDISTGLAEGLEMCEIVNKYIFFIKSCEIEEMDEFGEFMIRYTFINVRNADIDYCSGNSNKIE